MKILPNKAFFSKDDILFIEKNFRKILNGKSFLSQYKFSEDFENKFKNYVNSKASVSCNSGTSALEIIFRTINIVDKEVIIPSNTFLATALGVINAGGKIKFADCNEDMCISYDSILENITKNTAAIIIVHIGGIISKDFHKIKELCKKNKIILVEDAAQAHGSKLKNEYTGNLGDFAAFSFYSTKIMTTGEGGMITFRNKKYKKKMQSIREFGKVKKGFYINYHKYIGYNWRFQEVNALMGIRQLQNIEKFIKKRERLIKIYIDELRDIKDIQIVNPFQNKAIRQNYYKFIIILKRHNREKIQKELLKKSINLSGYVYEIPLHKQPIFKNHKHKNLKVSERMCAQHICLPLYHEMTEKQAYYLTANLKKILQN